MASFVFNNGRGRVPQLIDDAATIKVLLLKVAESDAGLKDRDTVAAILAAANTEADFITNYARKTLTGLTSTVDDTNEKVNSDCSDVTWASAGGITNNTLVKAIFYWDADGTDANAIPLAAFDFAVTTDGSNLTLRTGTSGFYEVRDVA